MLQLVSPAYLLLVTHDFFFSPTHPLMSIAPLDKTVCVEQIDTWLTRVGEQDATVTYYGTQLLVGFESSFLEWPLLLLMLLQSDHQQQFDVNLWPVNKKLSEIIQPYKINRGFNKYRRLTKCVRYFAHRSRLLFSRKNRQLVWIML